MSAALRPTVASATECGSSSAPSSKESELREFVAPQGRICGVSMEETGDGRIRTEEHTLAAVVAASKTQRAGVAGDTGLDHDVVAWL